MSTNDTNDTDSWQQEANTFTCTTNAMRMKELPRGIYRYVADPLGGRWWLEKTASRFEFPYKIYGHYDPILRRVETAWSKLDSNLGILLNGIKGTGKTITAQMIANWGIDNSFLVLVVTSPIPLTEVLGKISQSALVIFDEFEKTHSENEAQQSLLTAIDGMARNQHRRMFVFTTNDKTVNHNFIDRPSRIRYCWEFNRLADNVLDSLIDDLLDPDLRHLRPSLIAYLNTRKVLSIDVAKTVISEVNIFREDPETFSEVLGLSEQDAKGFTLEILDSKRNPIRTLANNFHLQQGERNQLRAALTRSGRERFIIDCLGEYTIDYTDSFQNLTIEIIEETPSPLEWICKVRVPFYETWVRKYKRVEDAHDRESVWVDKKPEGWRIPEWASKFQRNDDLDKEEQTAMDKWRDSESVFGTDQIEFLLIRITPNLEERSVKLGDFSVF